MAQIFDLIIIGGGIAGTGIARDAALRGAKPLLIEKNLLGSGTSSKSSKLIHGGIRYMELAWDGLLKGRLDVFYKNFRFVFLSLGECRLLEYIAPKLVKPLPIIIPIYKHSPRGKITTMLGVYLYYFLARFSGRATAPTAYWTKKSMLQKMPQLDEHGLIGGIQFWDRLTTDQELVKAVGRSASENGAIIKEYERLIEYKHDVQKQVYTVCTENSKGEQKEYKGRVLVNAGGPWIDQILKSGSDPSPALVSPVSGCHIETKPFLATSVLLQAKDKRIFFCINMGDKVRIGTTETSQSNPDLVHATTHEIEYLLDSIKRYFPKVNIGVDDILKSDAGIRPLFKTKQAKNANSISRDHEIMRTTTGIWNMVGVKLTDHRRAAEEFMNTIHPDLIKFNANISPKSTTGQTKL
ncbi:MAG: glycerol-3-phosphate dehydrogenase [Candidatus Omnitrophota bacterium]|jgi:glycerol-3-phosphate dehydrogenase